MTGSEEPFDSVCIMCILRHADRTCKQKICLKFRGSPPSGFPVNEDIRGPSVIERLYSMMNNYKSDCISEVAMYMNGLRKLKSGRDDLKLKIERTEQGWLLKLKWGGNLTPLGFSQSESAGEVFRGILPPAQFDVKAFSSGDIRCQETAGSFLKGLIGVSDFPIRSDDGPDGLGNLDDTPFRHSSVVEQLREDIGKTLMSGRPIDDEFMRTLFPDDQRAHTGMMEIRNEYKTFASAVIHLKGLVNGFVSLIKHLEGSISLYASEDMSLLVSRWHHIERALNRVDPSRDGGSASSASVRWKSEQTTSGVLFTAIQISLISEIYDNSNYDYRHNASTLRTLALDAYNELACIRTLVTKLFQIVTPLEYGISKQDKAFIGTTFLHPLIRKLRFDFRLSANLPIGDEAMYLSKHEEKVDSINPRVRLYFAHHSHVFSLVSILRSIALPESFTCNESVLLAVKSLGYLSQIVFNVLANKSRSTWKVTIDIYPGDDQTGGPLKINYMRIVEGLTPNPEQIDSFFSDILLLPSRDTNRSTPSHLLTSIGESSAETLVEDH